jgi:hypothetical protein
MTIESQLEHMNLRSPIVPTTPMEMLARAITSGAAPETLEKMMAMQERWESNQARKLYDKAIAAAKAEIKPIAKNRTVSHGSGKTSYQHEDLAEIERSVVPALSKYGLSYRFRTSAEKDRIVVTCIVSHEGGYSEENSLAGPPDTSGAKNAIQAIGSTVTYLQRYSLKAALGLSASIDDDGAGGDAADTFFVDAAQIAELRKLIERSGRTEELFCKKFMAEKIELLPVSKFETATTFLQDIIKREQL